MLSKVDTILRLYNNFGSFFWNLQKNSEGNYPIAKPTCWFVEGPVALITYHRYGLSLTTDDRPCCLYRSHVVPVWLLAAPVCPVDWL